MVIGREGNTEDHLLGNGRGTSCPGHGNVGTQFRKVTDQVQKEVHAEDHDSDRDPIDRQDTVHTRDKVVTSGHQARKFCNRKIGREK